MQDYKLKAAAAADFLKQRISALPGIGFLTGTGLGQSAESITAEAVFDFQDVPHFPLPTVATHRGRLIIGKLHGCRVIALQGRLHLYEGYTPLEATFPIRVMQELGVKTLIISNASGGLNASFDPGDIMLITDHINLTGANPLIGPNEDSWGTRFPDMTHAYDGSLADLAASIAQEARIDLQKGVYVGLKGPSLETPAEVRFLQTIGADAVGFSTVLEVIAAVHAKMRVLGLSIIANVHDPDNPVPASVAEIIAQAENTAPRLDMLITKIIGSL